MDGWLVEQPAVNAMMAPSTSRRSWKADRLSSRRFMVAPVRVDAVDMFCTIRYKIAVVKDFIQNGTKRSQTSRTPARLRSRRRSAACAGHVLGGRLFGHVAGRSRRRD